MNGIRFEDAPPAATVDPSRADVACFVGLVRSAGIAMPADVRAWFAAAGVLTYPFAPSSQPAPLPNSVRAWFLAQGWIEALASSAAGPPRGGTLPALGTLAAPASPGEATIRLAAALTSDAPLFALLDAEIVAIAGIDATATVLSVTRAVGGTHAAAHALGATAFIVDVDPFAQLAAQLARFVPASVGDWLQTQGWRTGPFARPLDAMFDVPVPVESVATFDAMFDPSGSGGDGTDYLAAAIRAFFAQGGKRCYVVRMGDPVASTDDATALAAKLDALLVADDHDAADRRTWHGAGHLAGLPGTSFLALPDLPVLLASAPPPAANIEPAPPPAPVAFAECSQGDMTPPPLLTVTTPAPGSSFADYGRWANAVGTLLAYIASGPARHEPHLREVQLVAAMPLPQAAPASLTPGADSSAALAQDVHDVLDAYLPETVEPFGGVVPNNVSSAFLQLAYPWVRTSSSSALRGGLEPPDGLLAGMLARNALSRGTFASATKVPPADVADLWPELPAYDTTRSGLVPAWDGSPKPLMERISTFGFTPDGIRLLSDVTAYPGESYRDGPVNRLVSVICRAARTFGEAVVFESNGPALWGRTRAFLQTLMTKLWTLDAFDGATVTDAFSVRCDASTMTQNDLDNGRLVADVTFAAASTTDVIRVTLALEASTAALGATA
ncbi:MAG TPA: hypothetical protein VHT53_03720 [Candidatus Elarobacter sp.]|nr:hypothetical protein [Candidatus Elarobacter sp.]